MNFMAMEHWTDGWREMSLTPNDSGLRQCLCGSYILAKDCTPHDLSSNATHPKLSRVEPTQLDECIKMTKSVEIEIAARREYWWHLNHTYRVLYREHRDSENAAIEAEKRMNKSLLNRLLGRKKSYGQTIFTVPKFKPTPEQTLNNHALIDILSQKSRISTIDADTLELIELYRETSDFEAAANLLQQHRHLKTSSAVLFKLLSKLTKDEENAPVRFNF